MAPETFDINLDDWLNSSTFRKVRFDRDQYLVKRTSNLRPSFAFAESPRQRGTASAMSPLQRGSTSARVGEGGDFLSFEGIFALVVSPLCISFGYAKVGVLGGFCTCDSFFAGAMCFRFSEVDWDK
ncbi:hypothetical protein HAX54_052608 [Datura stramonium]|uniref:Uncharacterized protein n=1 Tax=Datura stramonium TaxID=4076 RepID=A0ABS8T0B8_DATST|nr:hypothetical protein [Datura stramonium]